MAKAFRLKGGTNLTKIELLPILIRLMMSVDSMRSSIRWMEQTSKIESSTAQSDYLTAAVASMGWAGETIRLIKEANSQNWVDRNMLQSAKLRAVWDELTAQPTTERVK